MRSTGFIFARPCRIPKQRACTLFCAIRSHPSNIAFAIFFSKRFNIRLGQESVGASTGGLSRHSLCQFAHPSQFGQQSRQLEQKRTGRHNRIVSCFGHRVRRNKQAEYPKATQCVENDIEKTRIMPSDEEEDTMVYTVVINHEEQYSIWPKHRAIPQGWKAEGKEGLKPECLQYVDEVWTDMRLLSLRKRMEAKS
jgi:MbtH protein